jgi:hypothetical protein
MARCQRTGQDGLEHGKEGETYLFQLGVKDDLPPVLLVLQIVYFDVRPESTQDPYSRVFFRLDEGSEFGRDLEARGGVVDVEDDSGRDGG